MVAGKNRSRCGLRVVEGWSGKVRGANCPAVPVILCAKRLAGGGTEYPPCGRPEVLNPASGGQRPRPMPWHRDPELAGNARAAARTNKRADPIGPYDEAWFPRLKVDRVHTFTSFSSCNCVFAHVHSRFLSPSCSKEFRGTCYSCCKTFSVSWLALFRLFSRSSGL